MYKNKETKLIDSWTRESLGLDSVAFLFSVEYLIFLLFINKRLFIFEDSIMMTASKNSISKSWSSQL